LKIFKIQKLKKENKFSAYKLNNKKNKETETQQQQKILEEENAVISLLINCL